MTTSGAPIAIRRAPLPASLRSCRAAGSGMSLVLVALALARPLGLRTALVVALALVGVVVVDLVVLAAVGLVGLPDGLIGLFVHGSWLTTSRWPRIVPRRLADRWAGVRIDSDPGLGTIGADPGDRWRSTRLS